MFIQQEKIQPSWLEAGSDGLNGRGAEWLRSLGNLTRTLQRLCGAEGNLFSGKPLNAGEKFRVKTDAQLGQRAQWCGIFRVGGGQHSGSGPGGLAHGLAALKNDHAKPGGAEFERGGESNDSTSGNGSISMLHGFILSLGP